jgi:hypothetical protein
MALLAPLGGSVFLSERPNASTARSATKST